MKKFTVFILLSFLFLSFPAQATVSPIGKNSTKTALEDGQTFTGQYEYNQLPEVGVSCKTDQAATLYFDFSNDGTNTDTFPPNGFEMAAGIHEFHTAVKLDRYFRIRVVNDSGSNQSYLRCYTYYGKFRQPNAPLNGNISDDSDAIIVRSTDSELEMGTGRFSGYAKTNKLGKNSDIDTGTVPEDVWDGGSTYTGFPTGSPENIEVFSSSASDTGTITFIGLKSSTSTEFESETITLSGTTPVDSVDSWYRIHTARYDSGDDTTFNVGDITIRHNVTTANVFISMQAGRSQSNVTGFTIPAGKTGYLRRMTGAIRRGTSASVDGALWVRTPGASPRLRRPFTMAQTSPLDVPIYGGMRLSAGTDIIPRIEVTSANNVGIVFGMDIILVDN